MISLAFFTKNYKVLKQCLIYSQNLENFRINILGDVTEDLFLEIISLSTLQTKVKIIVVCIAGDGFYTFEESIKANRHLASCLKFNPNLVLKLLIYLLILRNAKSSLLEDGC